MNQVFKTGIGTRDPKSTIGMPGEGGMVALILPPNWWVIPLGGPVLVKKRIREIVAARIGKDEKFAEMRTRIRTDLEKAATMAADAGYTQVVVFAMDLANVSISGSMLNRQNPALTPDSADDIAAAIAHANPLAQVVSDTFDGGWVVRSIKETEIERTDPEGNPILPELRVEYTIFKEGLGGMDLVYFTPFVTLKEPLVDLFDAVTLSMHRVVAG